jgi:hypothetical protein
MPRFPHGQALVSPKQNSSPVPAQPREQRIKRAFEITGVRSTQNVVAADLDLLARDGCDAGVAVHPKADQLCSD